MKEKYDVVIIGGSYAGMSAAMALGRSRRKTLVVDAGDPCNKSTPDSHNFLTQDGVAPLKISTIGKEQVLAYPTVHWYHGGAYDLMGEKDAFEIAIDGRETVLSRRVILAGGIKDMLPGIPGFKECWGKTIIHCPYCHGYEFIDQKTGILVAPKQAFEMVKLISNWTNDLKLFLIGNEPLEAAHLDAILDHGVQVFSPPIVKAVHDEGTIKHVILEDGSTEHLDALYAKLPFEQKVSFIKTTGCTIQDSGHIEADMFGKTSVEGIYAVGDCAHLMRSVATAVYTGNIAGAMLNKELIDEDF